MANTSVSSGNKVTRFLKEVNREYVRGGKFGPYIGKTDNAIVQVKQDLKQVSIPLIAKLKGAGVSGSSSLAGNEEALANYAYTLTPTYYRNGVLVDNEENEKSEFELFQEARPALMNWAMEKKRDQIIQGLGAVQASGTYYNYGDASGANLDTWNTNNQDRVLYGIALSNNSAGNHTTSLGNIDTTNDKLTRSMVSLAKRMAGLANPLIRPVMLKSDEPWYVMFADSYGFRDLRTDMATTLSDAWTRGKDNPLFSAGDLIWDSVIIKEVPDFTKFIDGDSTGTEFDGVWGANAAGDSLKTSGNGTTRVGTGFLCGAQALGFGLGRMPQFKRRKEDDYEHQNGVGISMKHDIKKTFYNSKQHSMVTVFYSAAVDS
jgi:N4-gp56 family major capsid protein